MKWFENVKKIEELRQLYRKLLKEHHPDNGGDEETMKEINLEYDRVFSDLSRFSSDSGQCTGEEQKTENEAFKSILNEIINFNVEIEIIGSWIWVFNSYQFRSQLKKLGFKYAPKKKAWVWHYGEYKRYHKGETDLNDIRAKYGSQKVNRNYKQYSLN